MKKLQLLFAILFVSATCFAQNKTNSNKITIKNGIYLDKARQPYTLHYTDISEQNKGAEKTFTLSKEKLIELHKTLISSFNNIPEAPISFKLKNDELRLYFRKKLGEPHVEIVHENLETEETGTLSWLSAKEVEKLLVN